MPLTTVEITDKVEKASGHLNLTSNRVDGIGPTGSTTLAKAMSERCTAEANAARDASPKLVKVKEVAAADAAKAAKKAAKKADAAAEDDKEDLLAKKKAAFVLKKQTADAVKAARKLQKKATLLNAAFEAKRLISVDLTGNALADTGAENLLEVMSAHPTVAAWTFTVNWIQYHYQDETDVH